MAQIAVTIVGIDCATQDRKVGLALGYFGGGEAYIEQVTVGSKEPSVCETAAAWIVRGSSTLVALDAPLGWPTALGQTLRTHEAGQPIPAEADVMFSRMTDRVVKREVGKQPLEVGAELAMHGITSSGYKGKDHRIERQAIMERLQAYVRLPHDTTLMESNDDALDAAVCVLAGVDFLRGEVIGPTDMQLARKEGWIWVRKRSHWSHEPAD